jgi:hypothetical protein
MHNAAQKGKHIGTLPAAQTCAKPEQPKRAISFSACPELKINE